MSRFNVINDSTSLRALVRAALLHRHGDEDRLLYKMREKWDETALKALGYDTYEEFFDRECHTVAEFTIGSASSEGTQ